MSSKEEKQEILKKLMPLTKELYQSGEFRQPNYILPMVLSAAEAICLEIDQLACIEFGVASGRGLADMCKIALRISEVAGIGFRIFGFDTYTGLPELIDYRDHPEIWEVSQYATPDIGKLRASLPNNCELVVGDISETILSFPGRELSPRCPLGFVSIDVDLYKSTIDSLKVFDTSARNLLPSVLMYFDDIDGNLTLNKWCGEELAIDEFNLVHATRKIQRKPSSSPKMFCCHVLDHPVRTGEVVPLLGLAIPIVKYQR